MDEDTLVLFGEKDDELKEEDNVVEEVVEDVQVEEQPVAMVEEV